MSSLNQPQDWPSFRCQKLKKFRLNVKPTHVIQKDIYETDERKALSYSETYVQIVALTHNHK